MKIKPTSYGTRDYAWHAGRQLASRTKLNTVVSFAYNADGLRVRKTVNGTVTANYTLNGEQVVHLQKDGNNLHFFYDAQGRPAVVDFNGVKYGYVHNLQGDIVAIVDGGGNTVVEYSYDAWGKELAKNGSLATSLGTLNPFRYRGYVYDEETGLYYLRSRYYNPVWGRFVNADMLLGKIGALLSHNGFTYCYNRPISLADTSGMSPIDLIDQQTDVYGSVDLFIEMLIENMEPYSKKVYHKKGKHNCATYISDTLDQLFPGKKIACETGPMAMMNNNRGAFLFVESTSDYTIDQIPVGSIMMRKGHAGVYIGKTTFTFDGKKYVDEPAVISFSGSEGELGKVSIVPYNEHPYTSFGFAKHLSRSAQDHRKTPAKAAARAKAQGMLPY